MAMKSSLPPRNKQMTLVEMMVVLVIFGTVLASAFAFFMTGYTTMWRTQARLEVNSYIRKATNRLTFNGRQASYFLLYDRFDGSTATIPPATTPSFGDFRDPSRRGARGLASGETGSCLVFVYNGVNPRPFDPTSVTPIDRIVCYTLDTNSVDPNRMFRLREFDLVLDPSDPMRFQPVEALVPAATGGNEPASGLNVCIPWVRGMLNGDIFHNLDGRSVVVNAQFFYGNPADDLGPGTMKSAANTYTFTITPRGAI